MEIIPGEESIVGLVGEPPKEIALPYDLVYHEQLLRQAWNSRYVAIIPYCFKCKKPLVWHSPPDLDNILFHCSECKRTWVKDGAWIEKDRLRAASESQKPVIVQDEKHCAEC